MSDNGIISGLDIGTTKIGVIIAEKESSGGIKILGVGKSPSEGLRRGVVVNLDKTVRSIEKAVEEAELMAGVEINEVYAGIAGDHIRSLNSRGIVAVSRNDNEITKDDVRRSIDAAKAIALPMDREIIHIIPQEFIVDDQDGIKEPVGMSGVRLEVDAHIVTGAVTSAQNIYKSVQRAHLKVKDLVLEPLASSYAVLDDDEKELGVGLLDIGGGTTDIAIFFEGSIRHTAVIGLGGKNITNDIALGLRTPVEQAEKIKIEHGCCFQGLINEGETIEVPGVGGRNSREVSKSVLTGIIQPRMEEIYTLALREIKRSDYLDLLTTGIVITGGTAYLPGALELAERVFDMPVKIGIPNGLSGLIDSARHPMYSTGVGLVIYGVKHEHQNPELYNGDDSKIFERILSRMKKWFGEFF
ncbi:cell division protein FtsA [candidate division KSB1 bacterium]|nr:MAG: cell division protein FtsA [candidate division KSB1 bacterium]